MKIRGFGLCIAMFFVFLVIVWAFNATSLADVQKDYLGWNYFSHILMIAFGVGMIAIQKADFHSYGFTLKQWRSDLSIAVICLIMLWLGYLLSFTGNSVVNSSLQIALTLIAVVLVAIKKIKPQGGKQGQATSSFILAVPLMIIVADALEGVGLIASTAVFQFFMAGFGEEILFRGYMQTRLNEDFGKPWQFKGVNFGPGLLIVSVLFGVLHLISPLNPFRPMI